MEVRQTFNLRRLRLGEEKKKEEEERKKKPQGKNIMVCPIPQGDHNQETAAPNFLAHVYCRQTAGWINMLFGMDYGMYVSAQTTLC